MKNILVLVDFTETANIAIDQAIALAKIDGALITIFHVSDSDKSHSLIDELRPFSARVAAAGLKGEISIGYGDLYDESVAVTKSLNPDLVVVGTHGKQGLRQVLFGSNIHKMVQLLPAPTLVVNDYTVVKEGGFKKVTLPVAPHADYSVKVEQSCRVLAEDGVIIIFAIIKPGIGLSDAILKNIQIAKDILDAKGVKWEYVEVDSTMYSVGYSKETLNYLREQEMDLISIMAKLSGESPTYGKMDKENLLLNHIGLPVLCANH